METLIWVIAIWAMVMGSLWLGFVILSRVMYFKRRQVNEDKRREQLGAIINEQENEKDTDAREALNEVIMRKRGEH